MSTLGSDLRKLRKRVPRRSGVGSLDVDPRMKTALDDSDLTDTDQGIYSQQRGWKNPVYKAPPSLKPTESMTVTPATDILKVRPTLKDTTPDLLTNKSEIVHLAHAKKTPIDDLGASLRKLREGLSGASDTSLLSGRTSGRPDLDSLYEEAARRYNVPALLLLEQGRQESINFKPSVVAGKLDSPKGARGVSQFMPDTAREFGGRVDNERDDRADPKWSIDAQARMMRKLLDTHNGDQEAALAAYNSGHNLDTQRALRNRQRIPETRTYVDKITGALSGTQQKSGLDAQMERLRASLSSPTPATTATTPQAPVPNAGRPQNAVPSHQVVRQLQRRQPQQTQFEKDWVGGERASTQPESMEDPNLLPRPMLPGIVSNTPTQPGTQAVAGAQRQIRGRDRAREFRLKDQLRGRTIEQATYDQGQAIANAKTLGEAAQYGDPIAQEIIGEGMAERAAAQAETERQERVAKLPFFQRTKEIVKNAIQPVLNLPNDVMQFVGGTVLTAPAAGIDAATEKLTGRRYLKEMANYIDKKLFNEPPSEDPFDPTQTPYYKAGQSSREQWDNYLQINPDYAQELAPQIANGLGQVMSQIGTGAGVTKAISATPGMVKAIAGVLYTSQSGQMAYVQAKEYGATNDEARLASLLNAGITAVTERIPMEQFIDNLSRARNVSRGFKRWAKDFVKASAKGGATEAPQEGIEQGLQGVANTLTYGAPLPTASQIGQATGVGGLVGTIAGGGSQMAGQAMTRRAPGTPLDANVPEQVAPEAPVSSPPQAVQPQNQQSGRIDVPSRQTVPEKPQTIALQVEALRQGNRDFVMLAGAEAPPLRNDEAVVKTRAGDVIYNKKQFSPAQVRRMERTGELYSGLGYDQESHGGTGVAVTAKVDGVEAQSVETTEENAPQVAGQLRTQFPNAEITTEPTENVVKERLSNVHNVPGEVAPETVAPQSGTADTARARATQPASVERVMGRTLSDAKLASETPTRELPDQLTGNEIATSKEQIERYEGQERRGQAIQAQNQMRRSGDAAEAAFSELVSPKGEAVNAARNSSMPTPQAADELSSVPAPEQQDIDALLADRRTYERNIKAIEENIARGEMPTDVIASATKGLKAQKERLATIEADLQLHAMRERSAKKSQPPQLAESQKAADVPVTIETGKRTEGDVSIPEKPHISTLQARRVRNVATGTKGRLKTEPASVKTARAEASVISPQTIAKKTTSETPIVTEPPKPQNALPIPSEPKGEKERALPKTLEAAGLEGGENRTYQEQHLNDAAEQGRENVKTKGVDGAIEYALNNTGIDVFSTGAAAIKEMEAQESTARAQGDLEAEANISAKRRKFAGDLAEHLTSVGQTSAGVKTIKDFASDMYAYVANKASRKGRKKNLSATEDARINKKGEILSANESRLKFLEEQVKELERIAGRKARAKGIKSSPKVTYEIKLSERSAKAKEALKGRTLNFGSTAKVSQAGAVKINIPPLQGDAELLAQYAAGRLSEVNTVADLNAELVNEFGKEVESVLPAVRQRAFAIRQEARLAEMELRDTSKNRRKTILQEIQKEIGDSRKQVVEAEKAVSQARREGTKTAEQAQKTSLRDMSRQQRNDARVKLKEARTKEVTSRIALASEARDRVKQVRQEYAEASKAEVKGYRESIKARRDAERNAAFWDTPLRNAAKEARERLKTADPKDPQNIDDLASIMAGEQMVPQEQKGIRTRAISPSQAYADLKKQFPDLFTRKNQEQVYKRATQRVNDMKAAAREAASLRTASKESQAMWDDLGLDVDAQAILIQKAEALRENLDLRADMAAEFQRVSRPLWKKALHEISSIPRSLQSSVDAPIGRQGLFYSLTHPIESARAIFPATAKGYVASRAKYAELEAEMREHPDFKLAQKAGLDLTQLASSTDTAIHAEEEFQSSLAEKLPHVRVSEQGFTLGMNAQRLAMFSKYASLGRMEGYTFKDKPEFFENAAKFINAATGRGNMPETMKRATQLLNGFFYSTRLQLSRVQLLNELFNPFTYIKADPVMRKIKIGEVVRMGIGLSLVYGTLLALGFRLDRDRDGILTGKIRRGKDVYDPTGGNATMVRFVYRFFKGIGKWATGEEMHKHEQPLKIAGDFARTKLAPWPTTIINALGKEDAIGKPANFKIQSPRKMMQENIALKMILPMVVGDFMESVSDDGLIGFARTSPALLGIGTQHYEMSDKTPSQRVIRDYFSDTLADNNKPETEKHKARVALLDKIRGGANADDEIKKAVADGSLSTTDAKSIVRDAALTKDQYNYKRMLSLAPDVAKKAYDAMSESERAAVKELNEDAEASAKGNALQEKRRAAKFDLTPKTAAEMIRDEDNLFSALETYGDLNSGAKNDKSVRIAIARKIKSEQSRYGLSEEELKAAKEAFPDMQLGSAVKHKRRKSHERMPKGISLGDSP